MDRPRCEAADRAAEGLTAELARLAAERFGLRLQRGRLDEVVRAIRSDSNGPPVLAGSTLERALDELVVHLTVGETFFYREPMVLARLERDFLPALARRARDEDRPLTVWSAGCATGEEAYTAAIAVLRSCLAAVPAGVRVIGTDINPRGLEAARRGIYREWSFRGVRPEIRERYFRKAGKGAYAVSALVKDMVSFHRLNLAAGGFAAEVPALAAVDLILCRNVLMYFTAVSATRVVAELIQALRPGGILALSPSEGLYARGTSLELAADGGAAIYRKPEAGERRASWAPALAPAREASPSLIRETDADAYGRSMPGDGTIGAGDAPGRGTVREPSRPSAGSEGPGSGLGEAEAAFGLAMELYRQGRYAEAASGLETWLGCDRARRDEPGLYAREIELMSALLANLGEWGQAISWCETLVAGDVLSPRAHFALGTALRGADRIEEARRAFAKALYLDSRFAAAELALAGVCRDLGDEDRAARHYANVAAMLAGAPAEDEVPDSGGMTAAAVRDLAAQLAGREA